MDWITVKTIIPLFAGDFPGTPRGSLNPESYSHQDWYKDLLPKNSSLLWSFTIKPFPCVQSVSRLLFLVILIFRILHSSLHFLCLWEGNRNKKSWKWVSKLWAMCTCTSVLECASVNPAPACYFSRRRGQKRCDGQRSCNDFCRLVMSGLVHPGGHNTCHFTLTLA